MKRKTAKKPSKPAQRQPFVRQPVPEEAPQLLHTRIRLPDEESAKALAQLLAGAAWGEGAGLIGDLIAEGLRARGKA